MLPEQSIEARRLLSWSQSDLASAANLALPAIVAFEDGSPSTADVILSIQSALEAADVAFIAGAGVRLRKIK